MIRSMMNLICADGHKHYSPQPKAWVGVRCSTPFEKQITDAGDIRRNAKRCDKVLKRTSNA